MTAINVAAAGKTLHIICDTAWCDESGILVSTQSPLSMANSQILAQTDRPGQSGRGGAVPDRDRSHICQSQRNYEFATHRSQPNLRKRDLRFFVQRRWRPTQLAPSTRRCQYLVSRRHCLSALTQKADVRRRGRHVR